MKLTPIAYSLALAGLACSVNVQAASVYTWTGAGANSNLGTSANWLGSSVPTSLTDATLIFNAGNVVGAGFKSVNNNLLAAPVYGALQFTNGGMTIGGTQTIALRPTSSTNFTVISNTGGNNTISAPLRFDTNTVNGVVLDNARIAVTDYSLTLAGAVSANQVNLSTSLGATATLSMNNVTAKTFEANGGTHNLTGVLNAGLVNLLGTDFKVSGANGSIEMTYGTFLGTGSKLTLDNTATAVSNRMISNSILTMEAGSEFVLKGNATTDVAESIRFYSYGQSYNDLKTIKVISAGGSASTVLTVEGFLNAPSYTNYANSGGGVLGVKEQIKIQTLHGGPSLADGLLTRGIVNGQEFATYDDTKGVISATTATTLAGATATDNVYITAADNLSGNSTFNSLAVKNATITSSAANSINLTSGNLLTSGTVSIAPAIDFGAKAGEIINLGTTVLAGGVNGSSGLRVSGGGSLELASAGVLSGQLSNYGTLVLSADNAIQGAGVYSGSLDIGSTTQNVNYLSTGNVTGTGKIIAAGNIGLTQNLVNVSLEGQSVGIVSTTPGDMTVNGNIHANGVYISNQSQALNNITVNGNIYAGGGVRLGETTWDNANNMLNSNVVVNGVISGTAVSLLGDHVGQSTTFTNQNTYTGSTTGNLILSGNGAIASSSDFSNGNLSMRAGTSDIGSLDRVGNTAAITLGDYYGGKTLSLQGSGNVAMVEDIGALNVFNHSRLELSYGTGSTSLRADALNIDAYNSSLTLSLGDASSFHVDLAPGTYTNTNVVKDVYVEKMDSGKLQHTWAAYDANNGRIYEALVLEKSLNTAGGNEFVRVTDATNEALTGDHTVGAVNINTNQEISGTGTLTVSTGQLLFWKDNTISIERLDMNGAQAVVSNEGTNKITSEIYAYGGMAKMGAGNLELASQVWGVGGINVKQGTVTVISGGNVQTATVQSGATLSLVGTGLVGDINNDGTVNVSGTGLNGSIYSNTGRTVNLNTAYNDSASRVNYGDVNLNVAYNNAAGKQINSETLYVNAGLINYGDVNNSVVNASTVANNGNIHNLINNGILTNAAGATITGYLEHNSTTAFTNHGTVGYLVNNGVVTNQGTVGELYSNSGTFTNNGTLNRISNSDYGAYNGTFTNNGTLVLDQGFIGGTFTNAGTATLNQGAIAYSGYNADYTGYVDYRQTAGTTTINGDLYSNVILAGGILKGTGNINGELTVMNGAQVNPGNSPGLLTVNGAMVLDMGAVLNMEVIFENGVLKYDQLAVDGGFTNHGVIKFSLGTGVDFSNNEFSANGQKANLANIFTLFNWGPSGYRENVNSSLLGETLLVLDANGNSHNWLVTAEMIAAAPLTAPVPVPAAAWLLGSGLLGLIGVARRKAVLA